MIGRKSLVILVALIAYGISLCRAQETPTSLTISQAIQIALQQSPQAQAARYELASAEAAAEPDRPVARPSITATASGTEQGQEVRLPGISAPPTLPEQFGQIKLEFEQPLYRAGLGAAKNRYQAERAIAYQNYRKELADIALSVSKACVDLLRAQAGLKAAEEGVAFAKEYAALVERQITAGFGKPVDRALAQSQTAEAELGLAKAQGAYHLAKMNLNRLLGRPLEASIQIVPPASLPEPPSSPEEAIATAQTQRPDLLLLDLQLQAAKAGLSLARLATQPTLSFHAELAEQTRTALVPQHYAAATIELDWQLLDKGERKANRAQAENAVERLVALRQDALSGIVLDVTQAWQQMEEAKAQLALAQVQLESSKASLAVAEKAYEVGQGMALDIKNAYHDYTTSQQSELQAEYDLIAAEFAFRHAQGTIVPQQNPK
ncbi:TolC family protein [Chthonomonas calidirosea]|uniref:TolC family protein n=1 Tax=Chthonomonas calidirosea TaxID=454171 RepID=UPI0006EC7EF6|nr:TolC family protein [Chthonomonas calidirosea]CEK15230.1 outer membrane protein [Chthonomonas calidirosea]